VQRTSCSCMKDRYELVRQTTATRKWGLLVLKPKFGQTSRVTAPSWSRVKALALRETGGYTRDHHGCDAEALCFILIRGSAGSSMDLTKCSHSYLQSPDNLYRSLIKLHCCNYYICGYLQVRKTRAVLNHRGTPSNASLPHCGSIAFLEQ
jgi:hypothetical protein